MLIENCQDCGTNPLEVILEGKPLCRPCVARRFEPKPQPAYPEVPDLELVGPDGGHHRFRFRFSEALCSAVALTASEVAVHKPGDGDDGYEVILVGENDCDLSHLVDLVRRRVMAAVATLNLERLDEESWRIRGGRVVGRIIESADGVEGPQVVIDGRTFSWDEFGVMVYSRVGGPFELNLPLAGDWTAEEEAILALPRVRRRPRAPLVVDPA